MMVGSAEKDIAKIQVDFDTILSDFLKYALFRQENQKTLQKSSMILTTMWSKKLLQYKN
jgi:hypothetical protein